jgi:hypothetical protein
MSRMLKRLLAVISAAIFTLAVIYSWLVWQNNRDVSPVDRQQIHASFDAAVTWLGENRKSILQTDNPALWRMVQRSADLTGDARLLELFDVYHQRYIKGSGKGSYWRLLFQNNGWMPVRYEQIEPLDDYQQFFIYAITCDSDLAKIPLIMSQSDPHYCDDFPFRSSCVTHQMMGLHLLQERGCGDMLSINESMHMLQLHVRNQLVWDPRLRDQYIQRVLMLLETGASGMIKPVWVKRIVDGAREDGGWPSNRVIIALPGNRDLIFARNSVRLGQCRSSFHATAQGLLIMAHLLNES